MKKTYILDTNVFLTNANSIFLYKNNDIVVPLKVLDEIDKHKKRQDGVGVNARNTISSPSVLSIKKEVFDKVKFDASLVMMMDCDYYYNAKEHFGDPIYYHDVLVSNRVHENQISMRYDKNLQDEVNYCLEKYK